MDYICFPPKNHLVIFTEYEYQKLEQITKVTENVTHDEFCNFLFCSGIVKIITKISDAETYLILKNTERNGNHYGKQN